MQGQPMIEDCGDGYLFDKTLNGCNFAADVPDCGAGSGPTTTVDPDHNVCEGAAQGEMVAHQTDCDKYYWCLDEQIVGDAQQCSEGMAFDHAAQGCREDDTCIPSIPTTPGSDF